MTTEKEITDHEAGLNSDFAHADVRHMLKDRDGGHHENFKSLRFPDRVGTNYVKSDALSCYKILPKGVKPVVWWEWMRQDSKPLLQLFYGLICL